MRSILFILIFTDFLCFSQNLVHVNEIKDKNEIIESFNKALINHQDTLIILRSKQLARVYAKALNLDSALYYERYCNFKSKNIFLPIVKIKNLIGLGEIYNMKKEYDSALYYFNKAEEFLLTNDTINKDFLILTIIRKHQNYFKRQDYKTSLSLLDEAHFLSKDLKNKKYQSLILFSYSQLYYELAEFEKAINQLKEAINVTKGTDESLYYYHPLVTIFKERNQKDSSVLYLKHAIKISEKSDNKVLKNIFYLDLIGVLEDTNQIKKNLLLVDTNYLSNNLKSIFFLNKAQFSNTINDRVKNCELALTFSNDFKFKSQVYFFLYQCFKNNKSEKALVYLERYNSAKDSIQNIDNKLKIEKAILTNEIDKKNTEITGQKQTKIRVVVLIFIVSIVIILLFIYLYQRQKKYSASLVIEKNNLLKDSTNLNKELSNALLEIEKNVSFLENSKKQLSEIRNSSKVNSQLNNLTARVNQYVNEINRNKEIQDKISSIKNDLFNKIDTNIKLSKTDKKLIMLIKLNMPTKEIAPLLNIAESSVEKYRYRLRKKLNIDKEISLKQYVNEL